MARLYPFLILLLLAFNASAQVIGKVTDEAGEPLIGVSIKVKDRDAGAVTDMGGNYKIQATPEEFLIFSYTGFETKVVSIYGQHEVNVVMKEDNKLLEQVVVVGYGTQKKKDLTTAVVTVGEKEIKNRPMVSAAEALQGKAAGVQVMQPSGKPGGDIAVRVRGATSVLAGNEPLYVVDGIPTTDIRGINPADIESMSVLKDASSAAIYGARAANGVVLITTKRGKENESKVSFSTYTGYSAIRKTYETLSTKKYRELIDEISPGSLDPAATAYTDWQDETFGFGKKQSVQLGFHGGSDKLQYMVSANYLNDEGIVKPARFDRYSVRINLDNKVRNWLKIGTSMNFLKSWTSNTPDNASSGRGGVIMSALNTPPFLNIYKADGSGQYDTNPFQPSWENPIAYMFGPSQLAIDSRILGNLTAEAKLFKGFTFKSNLGTDLNTHQWDYYLDPFRTNFGRNQNGFGQADKSVANTWLFENVGDYQVSFGLHNLTLLGGSSVQKQKWSNSFLSGNDFPSDTNVKTLNAANSITGSTNVSEWAIASFFGRAHYNFDSKYLITASLRRDGSSKLAHRWGTFPSFSAGWRISAEPFMQGIKALDDMKIRIGWGENGNQEGIGPYESYGRISYFRRQATNPLSGPAAVQTSYGNPDLKWETTTQSNVGIDLSLYNGRVQITADAYLKQTRDLLMDVQLPSTVSITSIRTNAGKVENKGIDLNIATVNTNKRLDWRTQFNISFNKNKVTELKLSDVYYLGRIYSNNQEIAVVREGLPLGSMYGYISEGVDPETGDLIYKDVNENGIFDPRDRQVIGDGNPTFTYGMTNSFTFGRFDFNFFLQGSQGNDIFNATRIDLEGMFDSKNQSTAVLRRWTPENRETDIPRAVGGGTVNNVLNSTRFIEDGSYVRLKSITLSYNINPKVFGKANVSNFSVYVTGQNLVTLTKYSGFDPEVNAYGLSAAELGVDYGTYPQARTVTAGINVEF